MKSQQGFSLVEIMLGVVFAAIVMSTAVTSLSQGRVIMAETMTGETLEMKTRQQLNKIAVEIRRAGTGTLFPEILWGANGITFQQAEGFAGGAITWGNPIVYGLQYKAGELDNGVDDNGDGLIDEMELTREQNDQVLVVCSGVAEDGLVFNSNDNTVAITLTLQDTDRLGTVLSTTLTTTVQLRN